MDFITIVFIVLLIISVIFHEVAHGYAAYLLGDPTAKLQGRLTFNPLPHIDLFGSILLPAFLVLSGSSILFGWAKPVPYNPYNLKRGGRFAEAIVALAGPLANIFIALFAATLFHVGLVYQNIAYLLVYMNLFLAILNLIPIPPLDGSKILPALLPSSLRYSAERQFHAMERGGVLSMIAVLLFLTFFAANPLASFAGKLTSSLLSF